MITPKSPPHLTEGSIKSSKEKAMKASTLFQKERYNNTHERHMHSSNMIKDISTKSYSQDKNQATLDVESVPKSVLNNSSFVIKYLWKRSTEDFPNYIESDYHSSNRSKFKNSVNYNRLDNLNTIDRMDLDEKKLNNSKLPTNNATTKTNNVDQEELEGTNLVTTSLEGTRNVNSQKSTNESTGDKIIGVNSKNIKNGLKTINNVRDYTPPAISRKNVTICVILVFCVVIAIGINFINLSSDYDDLKEFYHGFMGRRLLIVEGRLTSKSHILLLKAKEQMRIELGPQVKNEFDSSISI